MRVRLGDLTVLLDSSAGAVLAEWARLFAGWESTGEPQIALTLEWAEALPPLPALGPAFADDRRIVDVYTQGEGYLLHFHSGAVLRVGGDQVEGVVLDSALGNGQLEDVTMTALAPLLRARGYYLAHAFAAARDGEAVLLCGRSGSGKTTTGASLLLGGWQLLSNDVLLLQQRAGVVFALPTPGFVQVRPPTLFLLPALRHRRGLAHPPTASYIFPAESLSPGGWGEAAPVRALYFPEINREAAASHIQPLERSVALAYLVEESVDRWDTRALAGHLNVLQSLAAQADAYRLRLGADVAELPQLLALSRRKEV